MSGLMEKSKGKFIWETESGKHLFCDISEHVSTCHAQIFIVLFDCEIKISVNVTIANVKFSLLD